MKLLRGHSANKQNLNPGHQPHHSPKRTEQLRLELKSAHAHIHLLKQANRQLLAKLETQELQLSRYRQVQQELEFLKEQESNSRLQLNNFEEMNRKLRQQLENVQKENVLLRQSTNQNKLLRDQHTSISNRQSFSQAERSSLTERFSRQPTRLNSSASQKLKENHCSTPKSKMRINLQEIVPGQVQERRRVFF